jgi:hypothetical protein
METAQFYILAGLSVVSIAFCAILFYKLRSVIYLLEQPVVKKMSPALKLKPVKVDEVDQSARHEARPANAANGNRGPRPNFERPEGGERQNRDSQPRQDRGPRPERTEGSGDRAPRADRGERPDRNDRFSGRDRGPRNDRSERHGGRDSAGPREGMGNREGGDRDRNRNRTEPFANGNESVVAPEGAPMASRPAHVPAQDNSHGGPALAPRRPLPSTVDQEASLKEFTPPEPVSADVAADAMFMRDDSDIQHGRRNQLKKKPRFEVNEEDAKAATTEESKA